VRMRPPAGHSREPLSISEVVAGVKNEGSRTRERGIDLKRAGAAALLTGGPIERRSGFLLPHAKAAWVLLHERLLELQGLFMPTLTEVGAPQNLTHVGGSVLELADKIAFQVDGLDRRRIRVPRTWGLGAVKPE